MAKKDGDDIGDLVDALNVLQASIAALCVLLTGRTVAIKSLEFIGHHTYLNLIRSFLGGAEGFNYELAEAVTLALRSEGNWKVEHLLSKAKGGRSEIEDADELLTDPKAIMEQVLKELDTILPLAVRAKELADDKHKPGVEQLCMTVHGRLSHFAGEAAAMVKRLSPSEPGGMAGFHAKNAAKRKGNGDGAKA